MAESICGMCPVEVNRKMHTKRGSARAKAEHIKRNTEKTSENHGGEVDRARISRMFTSWILLGVRMNLTDALERYGLVSSMIVESGRNSA